MTHKHALVYFSNRTSERNWSVVRYALIRRLHILAPGDVSGTGGCLKSAIQNSKLFYQFEPHYGVNTIELIQPLTNIGKSSVQ